MHEMERTTGRLGVVIPTFERPKELATAMEHLLSQKKYPDAIAVIDDGAISQELEARFRSACAERSIAFTYYKKDHSRERAGLSESKNIALAKIDTDLVFFIDDDIYLEPNAIEAIARIYSLRASNKSLAGIAGVITNNRKIGMLERLFNMVFCLSSKNAWDTTPVGFQVWNDRITRDTVGYYSHGGLTAYTRDFLQKHPFPVFSGGRTGLEDVFIAAMAKKEGYYFVISPDAAAYHDARPETREAGFRSGQKESENRKMIFRYLHRTPSIGIRKHYAWSNLGWILRQLLAGHFRKGFGMISGAVGKTNA